MNPSLRRRILVGLLAAMIVVTVAMVVAYFVNPFDVASTHLRDRLTGHGVFRFPSDSMSPTLSRGQLVVVDMRHPDDLVLARGDLVIYDGPDGTPWLKRTVGMPGETIALVDGALSIDGRTIAEPYVAPASATTPDSLDMAPVRLREGQYFLLGDNRDHSDDSRFRGPIERGIIRGRAVIH